MRALKLAREAEGKRLDEQKRSDAQKKKEEEDVEIPPSTREKMSLVRVLVKKSQIPQSNAELHYDENLFDEE